MTQPTSLDPSPFLLEGGPVGVLLIHGFTGAPPEMRLIGDFLHQRGYSVSGPLLPGHGTTVEDMNRCQWSHWTQAVDEALVDLQSTCEAVFVAGLSMGSLLALDLAAHHPEIPGAILYAPALKVSGFMIYLSPIFKHFVSTFPEGVDSDLTDPEAHSCIWSYDRRPVSAAHELLKLKSQVMQELPQVTCPLLIIHSTLDPVIRPDSASTVYELVGTPEEQKELVTLHNSGHCLTVDSEWESVAEKTYQFIQQATD